MPLVRSLRVPAAGAETKNDASRPDPRFSTGCKTGMAAVKGKGKKCKSIGIVSLEYPVVSGFRCSSGMKRPKISPICLNDFCFIEAILSAKIC